MTKEKVSSLYKIIKTQLHVCDMTFHIVDRHSDAKRRHLAFIVHGSLGTVHSITTAIVYRSQKSI